MKAQHPLAAHPLEYAAFEKIRRNGIQRAGGKTIWHGGQEWLITVNVISTLTTSHVVLKRLDKSAVSHQQAMAILDITNNGYQGGPDGLSLLLPALQSGIQVAGHPLTRSYRVLPCLEVPGIFTEPNGD